MIILIAGASHTGKTVLAQQLLEQYKYPYLSIDHIKMGLIRSGNTRLTPEEDEELVSYLWPIVREIIKTAIENHQNMIVEGCYIPFDWEKDFKEEYRKEMKYCCLVMTQSYIENHFQDIKAHASDVEKRLDDSDCNAEALVQENNRNLEMCKKYGCPYILIEDGYEVLEHVWALICRETGVRKELLNKIAPCSLVCHTCGGYAQGIICESAKQLSEYLEGVQEFYEKHCPDKVGRFRVFTEELEQFATGKCSGCRNREHHSCSIKGCFILECTKEHGVDFCGECHEFPCNKTQAIFEEEVYLQWLEGNKEIKALGIEEFWEKNRVRPHYKPYRKRRYIQEIKS